MLLRVGLLPMQLLEPSHVPGGQNSATALCSVPPPCQVWESIGIDMADYGQPFSDAPLQALHTSALRRMEALAEAGVCAVVLCQAADAHAGQGVKSAGPASLQLRPVKQPAFDHQPAA